MKLNLGCGLQQPAGWLNVDRDDYGQDHVADFQELALTAASATMVALHHVLSMWTRGEVAAELKVIHDLMIPGAHLRISDIDVMAGVRAFERGDFNWFPDTADTLEDRFEIWLSWHGTRRSFWSPLSLGDACRVAGFSSWHTTEFGVSSVEGLADLDLREQESFFMEVVK